MWDLPRPARTHVPCIGRQFSTTAPRGKSICLFVSNYRLGADYRLWFSCPAVLDAVVVLDQGLAEGLGLLTAREEVITNGAVDTSHPIT